MRFPPFPSFLLPLMLAGSCLWVCGSATAQNRTTTRLYSQSAAASTRVKPAASPTGDKQPEKLNWDDLEKLIKTTLAQTKDYRPGDLITQEEAGKVFPALKAKGWEVKSSKEVTEHLLPASDELVRQLRAQPGKKFMRKIGSVSQGFDRLDKLRGLPYGSRRVRELMNDPGGYSLIEYMATTKGGQTLGRQLTATGRGDFNAPTDRIYTESDLLGALKALYDAEHSPAKARRSP